MTLGEISEAIPPAYSEWIARQWLASEKRPNVRQKADSPRQTKLGL